jgi:hypothetical protein
MFYTHPNKYLFLHGYGQINAIRALPAKRAGITRQGDEKMVD